MLDDSNLERCVKQLKTTPLFFWKQNGYPTRYLLFLVWHSGLTETASHLLVAHTPVQKKEKSQFWNPLQGNQGSMHQIVRLR